MDYGKCPILQECVKVSRLEVAEWEGCSRAARTMVFAGARRRAHLIEANRRKSAALVES